MVSSLFSDASLSGEVVCTSRCRLKLTELENLSFTMLAVGLDTLSDATVSQSIESTPMNTIVYSESALAESNKDRGLKMSTMDYPTMTGLVARNHKFPSSLLPPLYRRNLLR